MKVAATEKGAAPYGVEDQIFVSSSRVLGRNYTSALASTREVSPKDRKQQGWWSLSQRLFSKDMELHALATEKASLCLCETVLRWEEWA